MTDFSNTKSIYLQIVEIVKKRIITDKYTEQERIPSVRELAVELQVNPNTCVRAFEVLSRDNIIINKRGVGYFVNSGAKLVILEDKRKKFIVDELPRVVNNMKILNISLDDFMHIYNDSQF